jgi:wyosine [tRNA(Phe)-imidazoG37] synthetase (radical SAM superfamily)
MIILSSQIVFGPVPSRRLGRSLGVNNLPPPKTCNYNCIYCQLGRTINYFSERRCFYDPELVVNEVLKAVEKLRDVIDYITFVPDGEPTLDACLGREIEKIKRNVDVKIAVLSNASLLYDPDVRTDLSSADLVSIKIDAFRERTWRIINRPHPSLRLDKIFEGVEEFTRNFRGEIISETMLIENFNTDSEEIEEIARFLKKIDISKAYIAIPTRPPAEPYAKPASHYKIVETHEIFSRHLGIERVELLNMPEPPQFIIWGDPVKWLLSTLSVHPMRYDYVIKTLQRITGDPEKIINDLISRKEIMKIIYRDTVYLVRSYRK